VNESISPTVGVRVQDLTGAVLPGIQIRLFVCQGPSSQEQFAYTDAIGVAAFPGFQLAQAGTYKLCAQGGANLPGGAGSWQFLMESDPFDVFVTGASTKRRGPQAQHIYALKLPAGTCHPNTQDFPTCYYLDTGDTLPVGPDYTFLFGSVFDTGSTVVLVNNVTTPYGFSDANTLNLCNATVGCSVPNTYPYHDPYLPLDLTVRLWGLSSYVSGDGVDSTEVADVPAIQVRPGSQSLLPTLIGAPVAALVIASIDYATSVTKQSPFGPWTAPNIRFYLPGAAGIPAPPYKVRLERRGAFGVAPTDGASVGPRFMVKNVAIERGGYRVTDSTVGVLYDTGSTTTVVTEAVATLLGIDLVNETPVDVYHLNTVRGEAVVRGYLVDRFSITTREGLHEYGIDNPMIYVQPNLTDPPRSPFPDGIDVVLGSNYFAWTRVLFDGPGDTLGLWEAVSLDPDGDGRANAWDNCPTIYNPDQRDNDLDGLGNACDPDNDNDNVPNVADNCPLHFNPDQVNSDGDTLGDVCDPDQTATVITPGTATSLSTPDGAVSVQIPADAVTSPTPSTLSFLPGDSGFQVIGSIGSGASAQMEVLISYDVRVGGSTSFPLNTPAMLVFQVAASPTANQAFATHTLTIASKEDTDNNGSEDTFVLIPDCASGEKTVDGRCTMVTALDKDHNGLTDTYQLSAPVTHFSTYAVVALPVCAAVADLDPKTLNRKSNGNWVTVYLEFRGCRCGPASVELPTLRLWARTPVTSSRIAVAPGAPASVGDADRDGVPDLMIKFDRAVVSSWFQAPGQATFAIQGNFKDGTLFRGTTGPVRIQ
jgi:hypothetical protein